MKTKSSLNLEVLGEIVNYIKIEIEKEDLERKSDFLRYSDIVERLAGQLNEIEKAMIYENFIFELSYFYLLCLIYSEYIFFKFKLKVDYKFLANKIDTNSIYTWFEIPLELEKIIENKLEKRHLKFFSNNIVTEFYEVMISIEEKKRIGQFYTPQNIASYMIKELQLNKLDFSDNTKIIDPACGAGIFLSEVTKSLSGSIKGLKLAKYCYYNLYGNDINPFATILTKFNICFEILNTIDSEKEANIFLNKYIELPNIVLKNTITEKSDIKYNYIVGNPPYFKIKNAKFDNYSYYKDIMYGQTNIYALFIYWALERACDKAKISLIIPQSFRSGLYFKKIRQKLFNLKILSIINFKSRNKVFKNVEQAVVILTIQNTIKKKNNKVKILHVDEVDIKNAYIYKNEQKSIMLDENHDFFFFIPEKKEMYNIISKVYEGSTNLKKINNNLVFGNGLYVWNQHKDLLTKEYDDKSVPIIYCNSIQMHKFDYKALLDNDEKKPYSYVNEKVSNLRLSGKKLIVQRTSTLASYQRIKACTIEEEFLNKYSEYFLENHVNFLYNKIDKNINIEEDELLFYEAILNSRILNYIFKSKNGNTQVSATELNLLPIKENYKNEIIEKLKQLKLNKSQKTAEELEEIIFRNYEISSEEIDLINQCRGE